MIDRVDLAPDVISPAALQQRLSSGERIEKKLIIRSVTVGLLTSHNLSLAGRDDLVELVFSHTSMWITFARNATGRRFGYRHLSNEQVALILIYRHTAAATAASPLPDSWHHTAQPRSGSRTVAVWIDREHGRRRQIPDDFTPGYVTWPLEIDALIHRYRPGATSADCSKIRSLLAQWAPEPLHPHTTH